MQKRLQDVTALGCGTAPLLCRVRARPAWRRLCAPGSPLGLLASCAALNPCENAWPSFSPVTTQAAPALFLVESMGSQGDQVLSLVEDTLVHMSPDRQAVSGRAGVSWKSLRKRDRGHGARKWLPWVPALPLYWI